MIMWYIAYFILSLSLFGFSFTQIDLSLTLSRASIWQFVQQGFQHIGFYQRPLATAWYLVTLAGFFGLYVGAIAAANRGVLTVKSVWRLIFIIAVTTVLSYPAFSYDMFNYMFTAKTVLIYQKNPYLVKPLDFTGVEPWLSFMRWTHLPSAYTPLWILSTLAPYLLGFGYLLLILWNMKLWIMLWYLGGAWAISRILAVVDPGKRPLGLVIYALNPLIIIESLGSAHNDIAMMTLALLAYYFYLKKQNWLSYVALSLSIAMKMMTFFLLPVWFLGWNRRAAVTFLFLGVALTMLQRELLPWYWVWIVPFVALIPREREVLAVSVAVSFGLTLGYAPYFYFGHYDQPATAYKLLAVWVPIGLTALFLLVRKIVGRSAQSDIMTA